MCAAFFASSVELRIARDEDFIGATCEEIARRDVADRAVQSDVVVVGDEALDDANSFVEGARSSGAGRVTKAVSEALPDGVRLMSITKSQYEDAMNVELVRRFEESPTRAMREVVEQMRDGMRDALEHVMDAEIELFLGQDSERGNKRNGYITRNYGIKGVGSIRLRVPRDRAGRFTTHIIPAHRHYDEATEKDLALLNLAGLSTRMLAQLSQHLLGIRISAKEVSSALHKIVPAAKAFLTRPLGDRKWMVLYVDGTTFVSGARRWTSSRRSLCLVSTNPAGKACCP